MATKSESPTARCWVLYKVILGCWVMNSLFSMATKHSRTWHESIDLGMFFLVLRVDDWPICASKNVTSLKLSWMLLLSI
jgi:hypothetical protein